jgi:hypothetical protein
LICLVENGLLLHIRLIDFGIANALRKGNNEQRERERESFALAFSKLKNFFFAIHLLESESVREKGHRNRVKEKIFLLND